MKKIVFYSFWLLATLNVYSQKDTTENSTIVTEKELKKLLMQTSKDKFESDLKSKKLTIYLLGGIVPVIKEKDLEFEKHYKINYQDFGCTAPMNFEFYEHYNLLVFDFLSKEYGNDWIASANKNAFGLKKWKEK